MEKLGTNYGGWYLPTSINLDSNSIVYSAGVGEDISFDLLLQDKYKCNILLLDPTNRATTHITEISKYYNSKKWNFSGDIQIDYKKCIENLNPDFTKLNYINIGLWDEKTILKFYKQDITKYVSQSLIPGMFSDNYDLVQVTTINNIMKEHNHTKIDLLKLDIEGAEIKVLNNMLDDNIFPDYICVEFDLYLKRKDFDNDTKNIIDRLISLNYKIIYNDNMNITFQKF